MEYTLNHFMTISISSPENSLRQGFTCKYKMYEVLRGKYIRQHYNSFNTTLSLSPIISIILASFVVSISDSCTSPRSVSTAVSIEYLRYDNERIERSDDSTRHCPISPGFDLDISLPPSTMAVYLTIRLMRPGMNMKVRLNCQNQAWFTRPR